MRRQRKVVGPQHYYIDDCSKCGQLWFDAGELAKLQLQYESSEQGLEMFRFRERLANMTEQERAELEARIANLPNAKLLDRRDYLLFFYLWSQL